MNIAPLQSCPLHSLHIFGCDFDISMNRIHFPSPLRTPRGPSWTPPKTFFSKYLIFLCKKSTLVVVTRTHQHARLQCKDTPSQTKLGKATPAHTRPSNAAPGQTTQGTRQGHTMSDKTRQGHTKPDQSRRPHQARTDQTRPYQAIPDLEGHSRPDQTRQGHNKQSLATGRVKEISPDPQ